MPQAELRVLYTDRPTSELRALLLDHSVVRSTLCYAVNTRLGQDVVGKMFRPPGQ